MNFGFGNFQAGPLKEADEEFVEDAEDDEPRAGDGDSFVPWSVFGHLWGRAVAVDLAGEGVVVPVEGLGNLFVGGGVVRQLKSHYKPVFLDKLILYFYFYFSLYAKQNRFT